MWIEYKLDKYIKSLVDELYSEYELWFNTEYKGVKKTKITNAIACVIYNLTFSIKSSKPQVSVTLNENSFSKTTVYNGVDTGRKVSYTAFKEVLEWMCDSGLTELQLGGVKTWKKSNRGSGGNVMPDKVEPTYLTMSKFLEEKIRACYPELSELPTVPDVIQVRDKDKNIVEKPLGYQQKKLVKMLNSYNKYSRRFIISVLDDAFDIQLRKVYNNSSFKNGGRSYVIGEGTTIMARTFRKKIKIDGEDTVEIDFKSLHPSLIAEICDVTLPDNFDPYGIEMDGYDTKALRKICKIAFLCMFNAADFNQALAAVTNELRSLKDEETDEHLPTVWKQKGLVPQVIAVKTILHNLAEHNMYAADWMFSGKGVNLQYIDSQIMDLIIQQFMDIDEFVLPVHDSIIVQERLKEFGENSMRVAYKQILGSDNNCRLEVK
jgi:hypothetical protein